MSRREQTLTGRLSTSNKASSRRKFPAAPRSFRLRATSSGWVVGWRLLTHVSSELVSKALNASTLEDEVKR